MTSSTTAYLRERVGLCSSAQGGTQSAASSTASSSFVDVLERLPPELQKTTVPKGFGLRHGCGRSTVEQLVLFKIASIKLGRGSIYINSLSTSSEQTFNVPLKAGT